MSSVKRILSGTSVAWMSIVLGLLGQIVLVPVFLAHWSIETYGVWLALQAAVGLLSLVSLSYQSFLQGEFLKLGREDRGGSRQLLWTALPLGWLLCLVELLFLVLLYISCDLPSFLGVEVSDVGVAGKDVFIILLAYACMNLVFMPFGGIAVKLLTVYGFYTRMTLWGVLRLVLTMLCPVVALVCNSSFLVVGLVWVGAHFISALLAMLDAIFLMRRERLLAFQAPDWRRAFRLFGHSQAITVRDFLNAMRMNGVRILMASFLGGAAIAIFSTNRTVANVMRQGMGTITNPLLPELMHAINQREQAKVEGLFAMVWLFLLVLIVPGFLLIQDVVTPLFDIWTQGKVAFDPLLFAFFAGTILLFTVGQPAYAVVSGNNLLRSQLAIAVVVGVIALGCLFALVPAFGLVGAAGALLLAELVSLLALNRTCRRWMQAHHLEWPVQSQRLVFCGALAGFMGLLLSSYCLGALSWGISGVAALLSWFMAIRYYFTLPPSAQLGLSRVVLRLPFIANRHKST